MEYGAVEIHENKILLIFIRHFFLPESQQELAHIFKVVSEGVDRPTQGNFDFVVNFSIFETSSF